MKNFLLIASFLAFHCVVYVIGNAQIPADEWDSSDNSASGATEILPPGSNPQSHGPHTLSLPADEADWFAVPLAVGVTYTFWTTGDSDTVGELFAPGGAPRITQNAGTLEEANFKIIYTPKHNGLFLLRVSLDVPENLPGPGDISGLTEGRYTLVYQSGATEPLPRDEWDPEDDVFEGSSALEMPTSEEQIHGPHTVADTDPVDWFNVFLEADTTYRFYISGAAPLTGSIFKSDGRTLIAGIDAPSSGEAFEMNFTPQNTDRFLLELRHLGTGTQPYTLHYQLTEGPQQPILDRWDPEDDEPPGASALGTPWPDEQTHGPHSLSLIDIFDLFRVELQAGRRYEFRSSGMMDTLALLFNPQGNRILERDDGAVGDNFRIVFTPEESGSFILRVQAFNAGAQGRYTLHFREVVNLESLDEWDPQDDTPSGATPLPPIGVQEQAHGPHSLSVSDAVDWFEAQLTAGIEYEFTTLGEADTIGELFFANNVEPVARDDDSGNAHNFRLRTAVEQTGAYRLRITTNNDQGGVYTLVFRSGSEPGGSALETLADFPLNSTNEFTEVPGGFSGFPAGRLRLGAVPAQEGFSDGQGGVLTAQPGQVQTLLFDAVQTRGNPVLLQASVLAEGAPGEDGGAGAAVVFGALDGGLDGSISSDAVQNSARLQGGYSRLTSLYQPSANTIVPVVQLANLAGVESATVYLDSVRVLDLAPGRRLAGSMLSRENALPSSSQPQVPAPIQVSRFDTRFEFVRQPGGFIQAEPGLVLWGPYPETLFGPLTEPERALTDATGLTLTLEPGTVELLMMPEAEVKQRPTLVRAAVKSNGPGARAALGILDGSADGSIGTLELTDSGRLINRLQPLMVLYNPASDKVVPVFQVANLNGDETVQVYIDNIEVFSIPSEITISTAFFQ